MAESSKINGIIETALSSVKNVIDADTVIGTPISTPNGTTVIPVSRVSVGLAGGGLDLPGKKKQETSDVLQKFGGGTGTGASVTPIGFLIIKPDGSVEMLNVNAPASGSGAPADPVGQITDLINRSPEIIAKIRDLFPKKTPEEKAAARNAKMQEKNEKKEKRAEKAQETSDTDPAAENA